MDADAVVKAINKDARNNQEANVILMDCIKLLDEATFLRLSHTLREGNKYSEFLVN